MTDLPTKNVVPEPGTSKQASPAQENKTQIHAGNVEVLKVQILSEMSQKIGTIANAIASLVAMLKEDKNG